MLSDTSIRRDGVDALPRRALLYLRKKVGARYRPMLNKQIQEELKDVGEFTILSNKSLGGEITHDANRRFTSPLTNTAMDGEDFLKFCADPKHYLSCDLEFFTWPGRDFPIARIDDIEVNFVHYKTPEECIEKWKSRAERIVWDNIFIIATDHDGMNHEDCMEKFDQLPYKNKIMFVTKYYPQYPWAIPIRQFKNRFQCRIAVAYADMKGHRYYETAFDVPQWIRDNSK